MRLNSKGFTLLEIFVVMLLIAMGGSLVAINVGKTSAFKKNRLFAKEMVSLCKKARLLAVNQAQPRAVYISAEQRRCWIEGRETFLGIPEEMLIEGEGIRRLSEDEYAIFFYPDGSTSGGELTLSVAGDVVGSFRIDVLTGMIAPVGDEDE